MTRPAGYFESVSAPPAAKTAAFTSSSGRSWPATEPPPIASAATHTIHRIGRFLHPAHTGGLTPRRSPSAVERRGVGPPVPSRLEYHHGPDGVNPMKAFEVRTERRTEFVEITAEVRRAVKDAGLKSGICVVYCPHTTAAITIQENADPDVVRDMLLWLNDHIPKDVPGFRHAEGNSDSHIKSSLVGSSVTVIVENGELVLGTWQGIYFCEFDGPRSRTVMVQTIGSA